MSEPIKLLMVCLGNICRSPMAEAILRHQLDEKGLQNRMVVASAGTSDEHEGEDADARTIQVLLKHGISFEHSARQFRKSDFKAYDWIFVMDPSNYQNVRFLAEENFDPKKLHFLTHFDEGKRYGEKVKDPWYGGMSDFELVFQQIDHCGSGFLKYVFKD